MWDFWNCHRSGVDNEKLGMERCAERQCLEVMVEPGSWLAVHSSVGSRMLLNEILQAKDKAFLRWYEGTEKAVLPQAVLRDKENNHNLSRRPLHIKLES